MEALTAIVADRSVSLVADDYYQEIESHFAARRGTPFILNAKDWALMQKWREEGIPLPVVIEAIDSVFAKNEARGGKKVVSSLSYCRHAVKELWEDRKDLQVGAGAATPEEAPAAALETLAERLEQAPHATVREFGARVRGLAREGSVPRIEERLIELEEELIQAVLATSLDARELRAQAAAIDVAKLDEKTRARTIEANLRRLVRERYAIPRLTMF